MPTNKNLSNLVINKVESQAVYDQMKAQNLINEDELYLVNDSAGVAAHTQSASTITAGTFAGQVCANATAAETVGTAQVRNIQAGKSDLTAGSSALTTGELYFVYE